MTEQHHGHKPFVGGHEIDSPPTRELFNIIWGLSALTLLSLATCVQLFNNQARDLKAERGAEGSSMLAEYRQDMHTRTREGAGEDTITGTDGKIVARYNYIPLAAARDLILAKPDKLGAFPPPPGWMHPDDVAAGGGGAAPSPAAAPQAPAAPAPDVPVDVPVQPPGLPEGAPAVMPTPDVPIDTDPGQPASARPVPGGTPERVGTKSHPSDDPAAVPGLPPAPDGHPAPDGTPKAQPVPIADQHPNENE